jgi:hypothetical protein
MGIFSRTNQTQCKEKVALETILCTGYTDRLEIFSRTLLPQCKEKVALETILCTGYTDHRPVCIWTKSNYTL